MAICKQQVAGADLEQVIEAAGHHVAFLDRGEADDAVAKAIEYIGRGPVELDFDEGDEPGAEQRRVQIGVITANVAIALEAANSLQARRRA